MTAVIICGPDNNFLKRRYLRCDTCECITETVVRHELWHGTTVMCCRCGENAQEGGSWRHRPFRRGWRAKAVRYHRSLWDVATYGPDPTFEELDPYWPEGYATAPSVVDADVRSEAV